MSKHNSILFSLSVSVFVFVIFTIIDFVNITVTPESLLENFFTCVILFIIVYLCYNAGYTTGFEDADSKNFDSYLTGFEAGCNFIVEHIDDINFEDEL